MSLELHGTLDVQRENAQKTCGFDEVEFKCNNGETDIKEHKKVEFRTMELFSKRDKLVQEVPLKSLPEKPNFGKFENVDLLEVKQKQVQKGSEALPLQRTDAGELKDVEDTENKERTIKDDSMRSSSKRSHPNASIDNIGKQRNEKVKPVQEGCRLPLQQSIHVEEFKDLEDMETEKKPVIKVSKETSIKRANVNESKEEDIFEIKEKPAKKDRMEPYSDGICTDKFKDGVNLETKELSPQGDRKVISPQKANLGEFRNAEHSEKEKRPAKKKQLDSSQEIHIKSGLGGENLATMQPCANKSKGVSQVEDQNADGDCVAQKSTDLAKVDGLDFNDADFTMDLEFGSDPSQPVSMRHDDLDAVKNSYFTGTPCQTSFGQQTTTKDEGNCVSDLEFDVEVCNSLARSCDDMAPKICITTCRVQAPLHKQSSNVTQDKKTLRDLQFKLLRTQGSSLTDQNAMPAKSPKGPSEIKSINEKSAAIENSEKALLLSSTEEYNDKSSDRKEMLPSRNCSNPKNDMTLSETGMELSRKSDCKTKQTKEELVKTYSPPLNPFTGLYNPCKNAVQLHEFESEGKEENTRSPIHALICKTINPKSLPSSTGIVPTELCGLPSTLHNTEKVAQAKVLGREAEERCPTPTMDEEPDVTFHNLTSSNNSSSVTPFIGEETCKKTFSVYPVKSLTLAGQQLNSGDITDQDPHHHTHTDVELEPEGVIRSTDGNRSVPTDEELQLFTEIVEDKNIAKGNEILAQICPSLEVYPYSQLPVMAVKPSKGDKTQGCCVSEESLGKSSLKSDYSEGKPPIHSFTIPASIHLNNNMEEDMQEPGTDSAPRSWLSSADIGTCGSLACTIFNTNNHRPESLLEKLSKRCVHVDPTQASVEQECLIFSEKMKQLLKRAKSGPIHQLEAHDKINTSCPSPVTVRFSDLEEVETEIENFDEPSFVLPRIKVDISDRKMLADTNGRETTPCPQEEINGPVAHASVSGVTAECARLYTSMMNDVCGISTVPLKPNHLRVDKVLPRTQPSSHFHFCDQMKREVDYDFCSSMNSVVRKFCKTKHKFFILATSNDVFFEKTKVRYFQKKLELRLLLNL